MPLPIENHNRVPYRQLINNDGYEVTPDHPLDVQLQTSTSPFNEVLTVQRSPVFSLVSTDPPSILRDFQSTTGDASIFHSASRSEYGVDSGTAGSGNVARLESAEVGRYLAGFASEVGIGIRAGDRPAGSIMRWGASDGDDGFRYVMDDDGLSVEILKANSVLQSTARGDWSVDNLDGNGPSGIDVDEFGGMDAFLQRGYIWQVRWSWYGYGVIEWRLVATVNPPVGPEGYQRVWTLHRDSLVGQTTTDEPSLPVYAETENGATLFVGGRQYSVLGPTSVVERSAGDFRLSQSVPSNGTFVPLIAIRRRANSDIRWANEIKVITDDLTIGTNQSLVIQEFIGSTVDDGAWVQVRNNPESAMEVNRTATTMTLNTTTGVPLDPTITTASQGAGGSVATQSSTKRTAIPRREQLIVAARVIGGQNATVSSALSWLETR